MLCLDPIPVHRDRQPFNYAVRRVQAHLLESGLEGLEVHLVESRTRDVDDFVARLEEINPDVIGASVYVWSFPTLLEIAEKIKKRRPDTTVVFGGPSARPSMFGRAPFYERRFGVDALALGEGEQLFIKIVELAERSADALAQLPGLALPTRDGWHRTRPAASIDDLNSLASPYVLGLNELNVTAHIESFRGCPLSCSFCQWGELGSNSQIFSKEYIARDFELMQAMDLKVGTVVDAALNLNPRAFRNLAAAARETGLTKTMELSFEVYPSHLTNEHIEFLSECEAGVEIGLGLQSYDKEVLRKLQRPFNEQRFETVARTLHSIGCNVALEIIMGLPGDNPESFLRTLERAQSLPCEVRIFHCLVLPDALMDRAPAWADMKFDPVTLQMQACAGWSERDISDMVERLSGMRQFETFGESAWHWQLPSKIVEPSSSRTWRVDASSSEPPLERQAKRSHESPPSEALAAAIAKATDGRWTILTVEYTKGRVLLKMQGRGGDFVVELAPAHAVSAAYRVIEDIAISYRSTGPASAESLELLDQVAIGAFTEIRHLVVADKALPPEQLEEATSPSDRRALPILQD